MKKTNLTIKGERPEGEDPDAAEIAAKKNEEIAQRSIKADSPIPLREKIINVLHTVQDPEIPVDIYELGLIYDVDIQEGGRVEIKMTLTSPACPVAQELPLEVQTKVSRIAEVTFVYVDVVWDPPWTPERMSEDARLVLGM